VKVKREIKYKQYNIISEIAQRKKIVFLSNISFLISRIKDNYLVNDEEKEINIVVCMCYQRLTSS